MSDMKCPLCGKELLELNAITYAHTTTNDCKYWSFVGNYDMWQELDRTRKALDICIKALNKIANTDIKVIEREPLYYARAMFSVTNNALNRIQDIEQINEIKGGK